jgi:hypothetical protein
MKLAHRMFSKNQWSYYSIWLNGMAFLFPMLIILVLSSECFYRKQIHMIGPVVITINYIG